MSAPFGVELPQDLGANTSTPDSGNAQESAGSSPGGSTPPGQPVSNESPKPQTPDILDLEKLERFRFAGREWKPKDLHNAYLMREDYTRKTQEVAQARRFADNFAADLKTVLREPKRLEEFKKIYPKEYVDLAERYLERNKPDAVNPTQESTLPNKDPRIDEMYDGYQEWRKSTEEAQTAQIQSWLDNQFETLSKKYPFANTEIINARAEVAARNGTQITKEVLEKLFKANDSEIKEKWEAHYKTKVNEQKEANKKAKDAGPGGAVPTGEPKRPKTIREATKVALEELAQRRG